MTRADGATAFQNRTVGFLLNMQIWFDGHGPPATQRVDGDLLVVRTEGFQSATEHQRETNVFSFIKCTKHLLLDVDKNPQHVLVDLQPLQQRSFTEKQKGTFFQSFMDEKSQKRSLL